jgi:hypothetical protein
VTSDAYLGQIARENGMRLATFDRGIKDTAAELIGGDLAEFPDASAGISNFHVRSNGSCP